MASPQLRSPVEMLELPDAAAADANAQPVATGSRRSA
jgi:hypothetical protein